jgi:cystathionine beta-synthase
MIYKNVLEMIGNTPVIEIPLKNSGWKMFLKLEKYNPGQSMKDRMALNMILDAENKGLLKPGGTIIESSSGNTAIGLAIVSAIKGYHFIAVVDHHTSPEKVALIKVYGGEIVKVGKGSKLDEVAVVDRENMARQLAQEIPDSIFLNQANNYANRAAYVTSLAKELVDQIGEIDELFGAIGTGGSLCGTSEGLKKLGKATKINAVEPKGSIIFGGKGRPYFQQGSGNPENAEIPKIIDFSLIDQNYYATDEEAFNTCRFFSRKYGLLVGGSSGGILYKAIETISMRKEQGVCAVIVSDGGEKYLNNIFNDNWMKETNLIDKTVEDKLKGWVY